MNVLIVKMSSMGDIIHTLPALTDAQKHIPSITFDWVVEESFAEIPRWHSAVQHIIPIALRRWRKQGWHAVQSREWQPFYQQLRAQTYDSVIDAQGLIKSAVVTRLAKGLRCGLNWQSAWEPLATCTYQRRYAVEPEQHAVVRLRQLFAQALDYPVPDTAPDYAIVRECLSVPPLTITAPYTVFLHGTTWASKHWPEPYWIALAKRVTDTGHTVLLPWGNADEYARAKRIAAVSSRVMVLPKLTLAEIASLLSQAKAVVAVDTGLGHLSAALHVPTLSLYGSTNATLTGTYGLHQHHAAAVFHCAPCLQANCRYTAGTQPIHPPCFEQLPPDRVFALLRQIYDASCT